MSLRWCYEFFHHEGTKIAKGKILDRMNRINRMVFYDTGFLAGKIFTMKPMKLMKKTIKALHHGDTEPHRENSILKANGPVAPPWNSVPLW